MATIEKRGSLAEGVQISAGHVVLEGDLELPPDAQGIVLFAHGSGSSRFSQRNRFVAMELREAGLGTLLIDLLTGDEERVDTSTGHLRFNLNLLAGRLVSAIDWLTRNSATAGLAIGLFGASTGGGAALIAAADRPDKVRAVVSRGGRPDLALAALPHVQAPTLLIIGGEDATVIDMNRKAFDSLRCEKQMEIIPGAGHLFEEPGKLEEVARLASEWFGEHLGDGGRTR